MLDNQPFDFSKGRLDHAIRWANRLTRERGLGKGRECVRKSLILNEKHALVGKRKIHQGARGYSYIPSHRTASNKSPRASQERLGRIKTK